MVKELRFGKMELNMKVIGEVAWLKAKEYSIIQMEIYIQENSYKIKQMDSEFIYIKMAKNMKDFGRMINKKEQEKKNLKMDLSMKVSLRMEKNVVRAIINGPTAQHFLDIGLIIILKEKVNINGQIREFIKENGEITSFMEKVFIHGLMVEDTRENMRMIKSTDMDHIIGLMANAMKDIGKMENNMVKLDLLIQKVKVSMVYGKMEKELNGLMEKVL
jgi:hypothetical protein